MVPASTELEDWPLSCWSEPIPEADALAALKKLIGRDALLKKFVDEVIVTINGVEHVLPVP